MYIYIYISVCVCVCVCVYVCVCVCVCNHENNVPSQLSPQWLCGNLWPLIYICLYMLNSFDSTEK